MHRKQAAAVILYLMWSGNGPTSTWGITSLLHVVKALSQMGLGSSFNHIADTVGDCQGYEQYEERP